MRYFIGIVPPEEYKQQIISFQKQWPNNRIVEHVEPHITVKAPNDLTPDRSWLGGVQELCKSMSPFEASLGSPGFFRQHVLFLSVKSQEIFQLHRELVNVITPSTEPKTGFFERDQYTPHLTLSQTHFGLTSAELTEMALKAKEQLAPYPTFTATFIRVYEKEDRRRYETYLDIPLGKMV